MSLTTPSKRLKANWSPYGNLGKPDGDTDHNVSKNLRCNCCDHVNAKGNRYITMYKDKSSAFGGYICKLCLNPKFGTLKEQTEGREWMHEAQVASVSTVDGDPAGSNIEQLIDSYDDFLDKENG